MITSTGRAWMASVHAPRDALICVIACLERVFMSMANSCVPTDRTRVLYVFVLLIIRIRRVGSWIKATNLWGWLGAAVNRCQSNTPSIAGSMSATTERFAKPFPPSCAKIDPSAMIVADDKDLLCMPLSNQGCGWGPGKLHVARTERWSGFHYLYFRSITVQVLFCLSFYCRCLTTIYFTNRITR